MKFPKHLHLTIEHNPHKAFYMSAKEYLEEEYKQITIDEFVSEADMKECKESNDFWTLQWYPDTPVGFCTIYATTLEKCLSFANDV